MTGRWRLSREDQERYEREWAHLSESGREMARLIQNAVMPNAAIPVGGVPAPLYLSIAYAVQTNGALRSMVAQLLETMRKESR